MPRITMGRNRVLGLAVGLAGSVILALAGCGSKAPAAQQPQAVQLPPDPIKGVGLNPTGASLPGLPGGKIVAALDFSTQAMPFGDPAGNQQGFASGSWVVDGSLKQTAGSSSNLANHLVYQGYAFGTPDGAAPDHYGVSVSAQAYQAADSGQVHGSPTGILALLPYYQDPTHYMLLVAYGHSLECWAVNGQRPAGDVWPDENRLWSQWLTDAVQVGQPVNWGAEVDVKNQALTIYYGGQKQAVVNSPIITGTGKHWVALAANGNYVQYNNLAFFTF